jgi:hypothetical protein
VAGSAAGMLSAPLPIEFGGGGPGAGASRIALKRVVVVRELPVPFHLPLRGNPELRWPATSSTESAVRSEPLHRRIKKGFL